MKSLKASKSVSCLISIDVGSSISGIVSIIGKKIDFVGILPNSGIVEKIREFSHIENLTVVVEDIRPYSGKLTKDVITTCKFIGELTYRLQNELQATFYLYPRSKVRKWVFDGFPDICLSRVDKKIAYLDNYGKKKDGKRYLTKDGELRKASFHWVDDRIVIAAMKKLWKIPEPKPFRSNIYGLKDDSWQALALASYHLYSPNLD